MVTIEQLIKRALDRHEALEFFSTEPTFRLRGYFIEEVREILKKGVSILEEDPWEEDEI
jgi:hypothetical protein